MTELSAVNLNHIIAAITQSRRPVNILWQTPDTVAFVARGREGRSEFHVDPSDEVMYMIKGDMALHYLTLEGEERITTLHEGEIIHCPAGTPHSPRFDSDSFVLVLERKRRQGERDRFLWYCPRCAAPLYEAVRHVSDYQDDPVSRVYEEFYDHESNRTCKTCGHITEPPQKTPKIPLDG